MNCKGSERGLLFQDTIPSIRLRIAGVLTGIGTKNLRNKTNKPYHINQLTRWEIDKETCLTELH
jgi:hypothetical protein